MEDISINSIAAAKHAYQEQTLRRRLERYHDDVEGAFWGWNNIWLRPEFSSRNIEKYLAAIQCPILAVQGEDDEYGTMLQIEHLRAGAPQVELRKMIQCRDSPHRDQPAAPGNSSRLDGAVRRAA